MEYKPLAFLLVIAFLSTDAMTEYERMSAKQHYATSLRASIHDEVLFKKQFNEYGDFLKQTQEKDSQIVNVLEEHFQQVVQRDHMKFDKAQSDLNEWHESIKNEYFLRDMDKTSVLSGIASCGLSAGMCYLLIRVFGQPQLTDADGLIGGLLVSIGLFTGVAGAVLVKEGWNYNKNHTKALQDELAVIKECIKNINSNYAYMATNKENLLKK